MPLLETIGSASAKGFGFSNSSLSTLINGASISFSNGTSTPYTYGACLDSNNNIWISGADATNNISFIVQFNPFTNSIIKGFSIPSFISGQGGCAFYNGNIYWIVSNSLVYFPITISNSTQTVNTYTGYGNFDKLKFDSSGNLYLCKASNFGYNAKINTSFNSVFYKSLFLDVNWNAPSTQPTIGLDGSSHYCFGLSGGTTAGALSVNSSGVEFNNYAWNISSGSIYAVSRTSDSSSNTYTAISSTSSPYSIYVIAQNSSSTQLWSKQFTPSGITFYSGQISITCDDQYVYVSTANTGNTVCFAINLSNGSLVWARQYSILGNYDWPTASILGINPVFLGGRGTNCVSVISPKSTGGSTGTYNGNVVTDVFSNITVNNSTGLSAYGSTTNTVVSAGTITASPSTITLTASTPIPGTYTTIPV